MSRPFLYEAGYPPLAMTTVTAALSSSHCTGLELRSDWSVFFNTSYRSDFSNGIRTWQRHRHTWTTTFNRAQNHSNLSGYSLIIFSSPLLLAWLNHRDWITESFWFVWAVRYNEPVDWVHKLDFFCEEQTENIETLQYIQSQKASHDFIKSHLDYCYDALWCFLSFLCIEKSWMAFNQNNFAFH